MYAVPKPGYEPKTIRAAAAAYRRERQAGRLDEPARTPAGLVAKLGASPYKNEAHLVRPENAHRLREALAAADKETFTLLSIAQDLARLVRAV